LFEQEILHEALLLAQQFMRHPNLGDDFLAGLARDDELVDPEHTTTAMLLI
jgi:hypothetical protein